MNSSSPYKSLQRAVTAFERLGITYLIGGSLASSAYGVFRMTNDIDIVIDIRLEQVQPLFEALKDSFYIDEEMIQEAIASKSVVNLIDLESFLKIDLFFAGEDEWSRTELKRRVMRTMKEGEDEYSVWFASLEDTILYKLRRYRMGGEVSDRQWNDIMGMMKSRTGEIDFEYLSRWASEFGVGDLLFQAQTESVLA